ncbi:MAG: hypothetical protein GXP29_10900 [Planctomycetes bacterium]|nr:hypothetical protein [Planctomycetota bacterium]
MLAQRQDSNQVEPATNAGDANWLSFDCETIGRFVRESAHVAVATRLHECALSTLAECEATQ